MLNIRLKYNYFYIITVLIIALLFTLWFSHTEFSNHMIATSFIIISVFVAMVMWYILSTFIIKDFRKYHHYIDKQYKEYLYYGPVFKILLESLVMISIIISFSQLDIDNTFKSSFSCLVGSCIIMTYVISLYCKYRAYRKLKERTSYIILRKKLLQFKREYRNKITNRNGISPNINEYNKQLIKHINKNKIKLNKKDKKQLYSNINKYSNN